MPLAALKDVEKRLAAHEQSLKEARSSENAAHTVLSTAAAALKRARSNMAAREAEVRAAQGERDAAEKTVSDIEFLISTLHQELAAQQTAGADAEALGRQAELVAAQHTRLQETLGLIQQLTARIDGQHALFSEAAQALAEQQSEFADAEEAFKLADAHVKQLVSELRVLQKARTELLAAIQQQNKDAADAKKQAAEAHTDPASAEPSEQAPPPANAAADESLDSAGDDVDDDADDDAVAESAVLESGEAPSPKSVAETIPGTPDQLRSHAAAEQPTHAAFAQAQQLIADDQLAAALPLVQEVGWRAACTVCDACRRRMLAITRRYCSWPRRTCLATPRCRRTRPAPLSCTLRWPTRACPQRNTYDAMYRNACAQLRRWSPHCLPAASAPTPAWPRRGSHGTAVTSLTRAGNRVLHVCGAGRAHAGADGARIPAPQRAGRAPVVRDRACLLPQGG